MDDFRDLLWWLGLGDPGWAPWVFGIVAVASVLLSLAPAARLFVIVVRAVTGFVERRRDPRRVRRRALFADHVESQLRRLDEREEWRDHRFARLEAEVEMEGRQQRIFPWLRRRRHVLRREKSLSRALQRSDERLVLLQGEPGSGKSVALRNAARALAAKAMRHPRLRSRIPLYVNLKEFRPTGDRLDAEVVRTFVLDQLNRANSRDVDQFLGDEFQTGMREGSWLFLFDSFDEIPDVLTAVEPDETVGRYADAGCGSWSTPSADSTSTVPVRVYRCSWMSRRPPAGVSGSSPRCRRGGSPSPTCATRRVGVARSTGGLRADAGRDRPPHHERIHLTTISA
ncbi:NACHT domain-containing protein [Plantactinospora sp. WMMC1484]|uniref:NACHT domain-containing protein n=1 Tax=Plantactinospora sp. WMMC1484 TaxID=3404122 RepID=UPI003BF5E83E